MTIAVADGYAIAHSKDARSAWERRRAEREGGSVDLLNPRQTPGEYSATLSRIGSLLPGVVRVH